MVEFLSSYRYAEGRKPYGILVQEFNWHQEMVSDYMVQLQE